MTRLEIEGLQEFSNAILRASADAQRRVDRAVLATAIEVRGGIVKRIQRGPATGRIYQKSNPKRAHQASAPGEAPATDTGRLASSIEFRREAFLSASVGSPLAYAAALEFGSGRIEPRPAWVPEVESQRKKYIARLERALGDAFR